MRRCPTTVVTAFPADGTSSPSTSLSAIAVYSSRTSNVCARRYENYTANALAASMPRSCYQTICTLYRHCHPMTPNDSGRWRAIKIAFAKALPKTERRTTVRARKGERGLCRRRFWEHSIGDDRDDAAHIDYVHINPVKHGLVARVWDWPYSSFHRFVMRGVYPGDRAGEDAPDLPEGKPDN